MNFSSLFSVKSKNRSMKFDHIKLYSLCILVGAVTGPITVPYRYLLVKMAALRDILFAPHHFWILHIIIIAGMWCVAMGIHFLVKKYPVISGSGIPQTEGAIYGRFAFKHAFKTLLAKFAGGVAGIGMGLSMGREGPSVQMGAFVAKLIGKWGKAGVAEQRYLLTGGASAGLSSAFTAPLASSIFVIEEMEKFDSVKIAITSLLAAIISGWMASIVFTTNPYALINTSYPTELGTAGMFIAFVAFSLILTAIGKSFNYLLLEFQKRYSESPIPAWLKLLGITVITYILGYYMSGLVAGGETYLLEEGLADKAIFTLAIVIIIKLVFTTLCYSTGFPGGIFLPLLVIGGLTGKLFALILIKLGYIAPEHFGFFMIIGMSALFATVVRSPITGLVLILEMTAKFEALFPMIVVVGFTYFISEMFRVKPVYDMLYQRLLPADIKTDESRLTIPFEISEGAYMEGKCKNEIELPAGCKIVSIVRNQTCLRDNVPLIPGDRIEINLYSHDLEKLFRVFRSMANE